MLRIVRDEEEPSGQNLKCPLCSGIHIVKRDKKGREYFSCNDIGGGTNIFPRTPLGRERLEEWKKAASVSIPEPAEEATAPSAPSGKDGDEAAPSADPFKIALSKFLERGRQDPS